MVNGVDALSITWMILTQARWLKLRFKMTMRQLVRWCDSFKELGRTKVVLTGGGFGFGSRGKQWGMFPFRQ